MPAFAGVASALKPKERIWSFSYSQLCMDFCKDLSYRRAAHLINAAIRRPPDGGLKARTLADFIERTGSSIQGYLADVSGRILNEHGFDPESGKPPVACPAPEPESAAGRKLREKETAKKAEEINALREPREQIKDLGGIQRIEMPQGKICCISIDDIGVKHQKDTRKGGGSKSAKNVENTVVHVQSDTGCYYMTAASMDGAFRLLMAFLLSNSLLSGYSLVFFADGAKNIKSHIEKYFSFLPYILILDWYHLKKKSKELISSSLNGTKEQKRDYTQNLLRMLWVGNVKEAIHYLNGFDAPQIKSRHWLEELIGYLERKEPQIACYALRQELGLRTSSNRVEKANDLLVAQRQKHSGMSWSFDGSSCLASIAMVMQNNEAEQWLRFRSLSFAMPNKKAA
jgi:hypothetical protein